MTQNLSVISLLCFFLQWGYQALATRMKETRHYLKCIGYPYEVKTTQRQASSREGQGYHFKAHSDSTMPWPYRVVCSSIHKHYKQFPVSTHVINIKITFFAENIWSSPSDLFALIFAQLFNSFCNEYFMILTKSHFKFNTYLKNFFSVSMISAWNVLRNLFLR